MTTSRRRVFLRSAFSGVVVPTPLYFRLNTEPAEGFRSQVVSSQSRTHLGPKPDGIGPSTEFLHNHVNRRTIIYLKRRDFDSDLV